MKMLCQLLMVYIVTWKAIGMGGEVCDLDEYTDAKVHCEKRDLDKQKTFNTEAAAKEFMSRAPKKGIKDMKMEKDDSFKNGLIYIRSDPYQRP